MTLSTGKSVEGFIIGLRRKGSEERLWLSVSSVPLFNPGENLPFQAYAAFEDITERLRAEKAISALARHNQALLAELQHRAKNSFNMITSMISLAIVPEASPETRAILESLDARVNCISELYSLLYSSGSSTEVQLDTYCVRIAKPLVDLSQNMGLTFDLESIKAPARIAAPIGLILTEVVTNAVKYAFPSGWSGGISISLKRVPQGALLEVLDDGAGLPALFDPDAMQGMGLKLIQGLSTQIEGHFTIEGAQKGTRCSLHFPLEEEPAPAGLCD